MTSNITQEDLIRFIYKETDAVETTEIKNAIQRDWLLRDQFQQLQKGFNALETVSLEPSNTSVDLIMKHSRKTAIFASLAYSGN